MKRIAYFDNAKGVLILFIILAHVLSLCSKYYSYSDDFFKFASLFMLQCFFFISAYFSAKSKKPKYKKILSLLKTYLLWQTLITIYYAFILEIIDFNLNYLIPRYTLWFLITMIFYNIFEFVLEKINYKIMIPLSIVIGLIVGFIPWIGSTLSLSRTFVFFPFYVFGYYAKELKILEKIKTKKIKTLTIILSIIILLVILNCSNILSIKILKGKYSYYDIDTISIIIPFLERGLFYIASIIVSIAFLNLIPKGHSFITVIGRNTLYIYLTQGMILKTFITEKILLDNRILGTLLLFICACILTFLGTKAIKEFKKLKNYKLEVING